jgi:hypothetical protein
MGNFKRIYIFKNLSLLVMVMTYSVLQAQQSNTLFFMHFLPESNFVNPAVQNECKLFIGLPVISSLHSHVSNSGFTAEQLLKEESGGDYSIDADNVLKKLGPSNLLTNEIHTTILAVGLRRNEYYYTFSVMEKDNLALPYTYDLMAFALKGNTSLKDNGSISRVRGCFITISVNMHLAFQRCIPITLNLVLRLSCFSES